MSWLLSVPLNFPCDFFISLRVNLTVIFLVCCSFMFPGIESTDSALIDDMKEECVLVDLIILPDQFAFEMYIEYQRQIGKPVIK